MSWLTIFLIPFLFISRIERISLHRISTPNLIIIAVIGIVMNDFQFIVKFDHVLAHASTGMCLAISRQYATRLRFERNLPDFVLTTMSSMSLMLSITCHDDRRNALNGIHLFLDRGYLTLNMVRDFTDLDIGVHGTIKNHWHFHCGNIPNTCTATSCWPRTTRGILGTDRCWWVSAIPTRLP